MQSTEIQNTYQYQWRLGKYDQSFVCGKKASIEYSFVPELGKKKKVKMITKYNTYSDEILKQNLYKKKNTALTQTLEILFIMVLARVTMGYLGELQPMTLYSVVCPSK